MNVCAHCQNRGVDDSFNGRLRHTLQLGVCNLSLDNDAKAMQATGRALSAGDSAMTRILPSFAPTGRTLVAGAVFSLLALGAHAQDTGTPPATEPVPAPPLEEKKAPSESDTAPLATMKGLADAWVSEMGAKHQEGLTMLKAAKDAKDPLKQTCVSEKVGLMKGQLRIATDATATLAEKIAINEESSARRQLRKVEKSRSKMDEYYNAAKNCAGAQSSFVGEAEVELTTSSDLEQPNSYYDDTSHFAQPELRDSSGNTDANGGDDDSSTPDSLPTVSLSTE